MNPSNSSVQRKRPSLNPSAEYLSDGDGLPEDEVYREVDAFLNHSDISVGSNLKDSRLTANERVREHGQPSTKLFRSWFVLPMVITYAALAVFAWSITCVLSLRPIFGAKQYAFKYDPENLDYDVLHSATLHQSSVKNERWYRAARVIQSIVGVLTIPLTSAVCSSAAVIYVQQHRGTPGLTIRQLTTLADRGWLGASSFRRVVTSWNHHGTSFLLIAIFITILGGIISPLQQIFLSSKTIKTPVFAIQVMQLLDISDQWNSFIEDSQNLVTIITRNALLSATNIQPQSQLWQGAGQACNMTDLNASCGIGNNLGNITSLEDPFLAQLPSGYTTGLIRQYAPRFNSTAKYEKISAADYPAGCEQLPGALFVEYSYVNGLNTTEPAGWNIQVCMLGNVTQSPWTLTRDRQDFTEVLYLNISLYGGISQQPTPIGGSMFRVTSNTTAGYFELPNYMNNQKPGPLLTKISAGICGTGTDCIPQGAATAPDGTVYTIFGSDDPFSTNAKRDTEIYNTNESNGTLAAEKVINKGPLLTIALALFGSDSFLASRIAHPEAYKGINWTAAPPPQNYDPANTGACIDLYPMGLLFANIANEASVNGETVDKCIRNTDYGSNGNNLLGEVMAGWISNFIGDPGRLSNVFTAAAFLANQAWISNNAETDGHLQVSVDYGADTVIPIISHAGIIIISILLAAFLLSLFIIALYASFSPRWTNQLDAFAMMKIGAAMSDKISLAVATRKSQTSVLDEAPGWIGDASEEHEEVGRLGLGAKRRLDSKRVYISDTWMV